MRFIHYLIVMLLFVVGCRGELVQTPGNVEVEVSLGETGLEVLSVESVGNLPNPPAGRHAVEYVFEPDDGSGIVEGVVADTRVLRTEFDRAGQPDPHELIGPVGIFGVRVPAKPGHLLLRDANGEVLGESRVDPMSTSMTTRAQALMRQDDVLGAPTKVVDHGDSAEKADILFLPDGYTEAQMGNFHAHVDSIVAVLRENSGYREHWSGFNVWRQDVRSRNSGTGVYGQPMDTAFETAYGISGVERCIFFAGAAGQQAARTLAQGAKADVTVVLVNSNETGGCASGNFVVTARPRHVADTVAHELGHALFGLSDEYEYSGGGGSCDAGPNVAVSASLSRLPWADMVNTNELPTSPSASFGTIGAFEGGGYCTRGRYRPAHNCAMRTLGASMCPVCKREMARTMATLAPAGTSTEVATDEVTVTNASGADLWVRCDSAPSITCSNWTFVENGSLGTVKSPGRRLVLHTADQAQAPAFNLLSTMAPRAAVTVYPNLQDPWTPVGSTVGGSTGGSTGADTGVSGTTQGPTGLSPDFNQIITNQAEFSWNPVAGATNYKVVLEWGDDYDNTWHPLVDFDETNTSTELIFSGEGRYRWRVIVCGDSGCFSSLDALFYVRIQSTPEPQPTAEPLATPTNLQPAHEAVVSGDVQLSWEADTASFNVTVRAWDDETSTWVEAAGDTTTEPRYTLPSPQPQTWHAWSVQACDGATCSEWTEYSLVYVQ